MNDENNTRGGYLTAPTPGPISTLTAVRRAGRTKTRGALWLMRCTCGHEVEMTARKIASGKARCPECFPSIARAQEKAILAILPATHMQIMARLSMTKAMAHFRTQKMREQKLIHVGGWKRTETVGGSYQPIFHGGDGKDVPCAFKPLSNKTRTQRYIANLRQTDEGREKLEIRKERTRALYHAAKAVRRGDPLVNAFFGKSQ